MDQEIIKRINRAEAIYNRYGKEMLNNREVKNILMDLKVTIDKRSLFMELCGIKELCKRCEEVEGGSCCGKGIELKYDEGLLIINLLLGCNLPEQRYKQDSCFFLGKGGCVLKAPHVICINYLCKKIGNRVSKKDIFKLREIEGDIVTNIFRLHEYLYKYGIDKKELIQNCSVL